MIDSSNLCVNMKSFEHKANADSMTATPDDIIYENIDATMEEDAFSSSNKDCCENEKMEHINQNVEIARLGKH